MKKILIAEEKYSTRFFDISTEEQENKVYLKLFNERYKYYVDTATNQDLLLSAFQLDIKSIKKFMKLRNDYEYETLFVEKIEEI